VTVRYSPIEALARSGRFNAPAQRVIEIESGPWTGPPERAFWLPIADLYLSLSADSDYRRRCLALTSLRTPAPAVPDR
jgi:hypothetical protein